MPAIAIISIGRAKSSLSYPKVMFKRNQISFATLPRS